MASYPWGSLCNQCMQSPAMPHIEMALQQSRQEELGVFLCFCPVWAGNLCMPKCRSSCPAHRPSSTAASISSSPTSIRPSIPCKFWFQYGWHAPLLHLCFNHLLWYYLTILGRKLYVCTCVVHCHCNLLIPPLILYHCLGYVSAKPTRGSSRLLETCTYCIHG